MSAPNYETEFEVPGMDCPSEERLIRIALQPVAGVLDLRFDLEARRLVVRHEGESAPILARLEPLGFGARIHRTQSATGAGQPGAAESPREGADHQLLTVTEFEVPGMDCPSEERLIRMALQPEPGVQDLQFDLEARRLVVRHEGKSAPILARLEPLGFGARIHRTQNAPGAGQAGAPGTPGEARVLRQLLAINASMFVLELGLGLAAQSTGLIADSVDMFADAAVYGLSLYGVGHAIERQRRVARASGVLQLLLALGVLAEVARRAVYGSEPVGPLMMGVSVLALVANVTCMALLARHRTGGLHMKASWIFSTNDVLANLGVILAGGLVLGTGSALPDLVIGTLIGLLVLVGAGRILRMARG